MDYMRIRNRAQRYGLPETWEDYQDDEKEGFVVHMPAAIMTVETTDQSQASCLKWRAEADVRRWDGDYEDDDDHDKADAWDQALYWACDNVREDRVGNCLVTVTTDWLGHRNGAALLATYKFEVLCVPPGCGPAYAETVAHGQVDDREPAESLHFALALAIRFVATGAYHPALRLTPADFVEALYRQGVAGTGLCPKGLLQAYRASRSPAFDLGGRRLLRRTPKPSRAFVDYSRQLAPC